MAQPDFYFILIHVLDGHFGILPTSLKSSNNKKVGIYVECFLRGAAQQTDIINSSSPIWNHRFMWQLTHKTLNQLKTDRIPVKLQFYLQEPNNKTLLGHVVLNLRDGGTDEKEKIYSLLHAKEVPPPQVNLLFRVCKKSEWDEELQKRERREQHLKELKKKINNKMSPSNNQIISVASTKLHQTKPKVENKKVPKIEQKPVVIATNNGIEAHTDSNDDNYYSNLQTPIKNQKKEENKQQPVFLKQEIPTKIIQQPVVSFSIIKINKN